MGDFIVSKDKQRELEEDFDQARQNYHKLITDMMDDLEQMSEVAKETDHPRAFEVLFNGYKAAADMTDKFMEHQRKKQVIDDVKDGGKKVPMIEGQVYSGSITDLQRKLLADKKKKNKEDATEVKEDVSNRA